MRSRKEADVLIIGGGFAGFSCFRAIDRNARRVTMLTHRNHFLFTPLLPSAATGALEIRSIIEPLRSFDKNPDEIVVGEAYDLDPAQKKILITFENVRKEEIRYQTLVVAAGATTATYGISGVEQHCLFLKEVKDARALREKVLVQFEKAFHLEGRERKAALRFVFVGGGPTGVETACEVKDLIEQDLKKEFPGLAEQAQIYIIEAGREILSVFDQALVAYAWRRLKQMGIVVRTQSPVKEVQAGKVIVASGENIDAETIVWVAGNAPGEFTKKVAERLNLKLEGGKIPVQSHLNLAGRNDIYAIGDCAAARDKKGRPVPATGQVAMKQGEYLGRQLSRSGPDVSEARTAFDFATMGMLASLGSGRAIADIGRWHFKGYLAWWFWKAVYLTKLVSLRNKFSVAIDWIRVRFFGRNTAIIDLQ